MKLGLHVPDFTWPAGPSRLGPQLAEVAQAAEEAGFDRLSVMDHVWQIGHIGPPSTRCSRLTPLSATLAGQIGASPADHGDRCRLPQPGAAGPRWSPPRRALGGRAWLGIGAAWNEEESRGLDLFFPRWLSGSNASKRPCRSACKCGATTMVPSTAATTTSRVLSTAPAAFTSPPAHPHRWLR